MKDMLAAGWTLQNENGDELDFEEAQKIRAQINEHEGKCLSLLYDKVRSSNVTLSISFIFGHPLGGAFYCKTACTWKDSNTRIFKALLNTASRINASTAR